MTTAPAYTELWLSGPADTPFYTRTYRADSTRAVLVFVHGTAEHAGRYTDMHTEFASKHNISVFVFDLRGFGKTALDEEHRGATSAYGKTTWTNQLDDLEWAIQHTKSNFGKLPLFIMGTSMGGGIVLGLLCDKSRAQHPAVKSLAGVIAGSPCITLTTPTPKALMWMGKMVATLRPFTVYPVRNRPEDLSRNTEANAAYKADPLVGTSGSFRSLLDMLEKGEELLITTHADWPEKIPVLFLHGTADPVTSPKTAEALFEKLPANDKQIIHYQGAYHELHNEPDGVREKALQDIAGWIQSHSK